MFWVISVYFNIRNTLPKSGTFLLGHPVYFGFLLKYRYSCQILMKSQFSRQIFGKYPNIKFHENSFSESLVPCGRTDMTKLIVAFLSFANAPSNKGRLSEVLTKLILGTQ